MKEIISARENRIRIPERTVHCYVYNFIMGEISRLVYFKMILKALKTLYSLNPCGQVSRTYVNSITVYNLKKYN